MPIESLLTSSTLWWLEAKMMDSAEFAIATVVFVLFFGYLLLSKRPG